MVFQKNNTCCFSGHRPDKFPWKYDEKSTQCIQQKFRIELEIVKAVANGYNHFITGMAQGTDMYCAEIVLSLKRDYPHITLECAIPFEGQENRYPKTLRERYQNILSAANERTVLSAEYTKPCFMIRNKYMVDKSSLLIAVYGGGSGGTKNTIEYAKRQNVEVITINPGGIK